jgi:hypothetical protein
MMLRPSGTSCKERPKRWAPCSWFTPIAGFSSNPAGQGLYVISSIPTFGARDSAEDARQDFASPPR